MFPVNFLLAYVFRRSTDGQMSVEQQSNLFLARTLQKIVADTQKKSQFAALRAACEDALGMCSFALIVHDD